MKEVDIARSPDENCKAIAIVEAIEEPLYVNLEVSYPWFQIPKIIGVSPKFLYCHDAPEIHVGDILTLHYQDSILMKISID